MCQNAERLCGFSSIRGLAMDKPDIARLSSCRHQAIMQRLAWRLSALSQRQKRDTPSRSKDPKDFQSTA